jgi:hypothetical protein
MANANQSLLDQLKEITRDKDLLEKWSDCLKDYRYIYPEDDPEIGEFIRYIDLRALPPCLKYGGFVIDYDDDYIKIKNGGANPRFWTIKKSFYSIFQKKSFTDRLLSAVEKMEGVYGPHN